MARTTFVTPEPVVLEGFQAVFKPSDYGYALQAMVDQTMIDMLEKDREDGLKWCISKLANPKRSSCRPEPWEELSEGKYQIKFSWKKDQEGPPIVDTEGTVITDERTPLWNGSTVKLAFYQKPYVLPDKTTYGTSLKLVGVQVVTCNGNAGVDVGDMAPEDVAGMFGSTQGFKVNDPNVQAAFDAPADDEEDEF